MVIVLQLSQNPLGRFAKKGLRTWPARKIPLSRKTGPKTVIRILKILIRIVPVPPSPCSWPWRELIVWRKEARGLFLRKVAPTRPGIAPERARVAPFFTVVESISSTGFPSRKMVLIFSSTVPWFMPNWSQKTFLMLVPTVHVTRNPACSKP